MQYSLTCKQEYFLGENIMKHINENGRSMVEMLGVLAIIGVLSVGGIAGYSKAMNKYKINKTTDQISMLVANLRTLFSSQGNYDGLTNAQAKKFGVVPNDMYSDVSGTDITNAFGGNVTIVAAKARDGDASSHEAFIIEYAGLSSEACVTVATGDWGSGQASGLIGLAAGKEEMQTAGTAGTLGGALAGILTDGGDTSKGAGKVVAKPGDDDVPTPITVSDAVAACDGADNSGSGYGVAWKYY